MTSIQELVSLVEELRLSPELKTDRRYAILYSQLAHCLDYARTTGLLEPSE
jgi:hypothetical protein